MWWVWSHLMKLENNLSLRTDCAYQNHCLWVAQISKVKEAKKKCLLCFLLWNLLFTQSENSVYLLWCKGHVFYNFRTSEAPQVSIYLWLPSLWAFLYCLWNNRYMASPWWIFFLSLSYFSFVSYSHEQDPYESTLNEFSRRFIPPICISTSLLGRGNLPEVNKKGV